MVAPLDLPIWGNTALAIDINAMSVSYGQNKARVCGRFDLELINFAVQEIVAMEAELAP